MSRGREGGVGIGLRLLLQRYFFGFQLRVIKIDVDKNPAVAQQYRVQNIPTLILFQRGQPVWRQAGAVPAAELARAVGPFVGT